jgi:hypothetical protein
MFDHETICRVFDLNALFTLIPKILEDLMGTEALNPLALVLKNMIRIPT